MATSHGRRRGAAIACSPTKSSSGSIATTACTTVCATRASLMPGASNDSSPDAALSASAFPLGKQGHLHRDLLRPVLPLPAVDLDHGDEHDETPEDEEPRQEREGHTDRAVDRGRPRHEQ